MEDCIFCKIINREIPADIIYESDDIIVFADAFPVAPIHYLVIPKKHISSMNEVLDEDAEVLGKIQIVIRDLAKKLGIADAGYRVITNCGEDGGQKVKHIHYHLLAGKQLGHKLVKID